MSDHLTTLFHKFDSGLISRRHLLQALGMAVAARPVMAFAQGQCADRGRAGAAGCETELAKPPFESTGWTTVLLDHFSCQVADYQKEAAYYAALMNWKIRSDDGKQAVLDIGDWGGIVIRGGYQAPAPTPTPTPAAPPAGGDTAAAAGRGGRGGAGGGAPRVPRTVVFDSVCWGIAPWDAKKVGAELKKRGIDAVEDNDGKGFESFRLKDSDGFPIQISNGNMKNRRQGAATGKVAAPAPFENTAWKTVWLDHISWQSSNYKESAAFYNALLGWKLGQDEGSQNECQIGDVGNIIIRGGGRAPAPGAAPALPAPRRASMDHIAFGITPWDPDAVKAELDKRGLSGSPDTGNHGDIHVAPYQSYHTNTPNGFNLQISNSTLAGREKR